MITERKDDKMSVSTKSFGRTKDGKEVEMAVVDEFTFENKQYVAAALVEDDTINADGLYIYRAKIENGEFKAEKIRSQVDYQRICEAYSEYTAEKDNIEDK